MGSYVKAGTATVRGKEVQLHVDTMTGRFMAEVGPGEQLTELTRDALVDRLTKLTKRSVSIPFISWTFGGVRRGTLVGKHASNGNYMVKWEGDKGTAQEYSFNGYYAMPAEDEKQFLLLATARDQAQAALDDFTGPREVAFRAAVKKALEE